MLVEELLNLLYVNENHGHPEEMSKSRETRRTRMRPKLGMKKQMGIKRKVGQVAASLVDVIREVPRGPVTIMRVKNFVNLASQESHGSHEIHLKRSVNLHSTPS
jgi:hypothetical protein